MPKFECFSDASDYAVAKCLQRLRNMSVSSEEKNSLRSLSNDSANIAIMIEDLEKLDAPETTWQDGQANPELV